LAAFPAACRELLLSPLFSYSLLLPSPYLSSIKIVSLTMGLCPNTIFGYDVDYLFSYPTVKIVKIQDARLGVIRYSLTFFIMLYIGVIQLWKDGGYLMTEKVSGVARFSLQQPTIDDCNPTDDDCLNDFTPLEELPYCSQATDLVYYGPKYDCQYYENVGLQTLYDSSILITTRVTVRQEDLVCTSDLDTTCPRVFNVSKNTTEQTYYAADVEKFTVLFDTSVFATTLNVYGESSQMEGRLYVESNHALCAKEPSATYYFDSSLTNEAPCYIMPNKTSANLDYFSLDYMMGAAGSSLDDNSTSAKTFRYDGTTLVMQVEYTNTASWSGLTGNITYTYKPKLLHSSSFKLYDNIWEGPFGNYRENRTLLNKHGIKIDLVQTGFLSSFSFSNLLVSLTTSLTLLAVASVITDYIALFLMPDRLQYNEAKYELTEDFSDIREAKEKGNGGQDVSMKDPFLPTHAS